MLGKCGNSSEVGSTVIRPNYLKLIHNVLQSVTEPRQVMR